MKNCLLIFIILFVQAMHCRAQNETRNDNLDIYIRETVFKVNPADTSRWEKAVKTITEIYKTSHQDNFFWLLYREDSFNYWLILFADSLSGIPDESEFYNLMNKTEFEQSYKEAINLLLETDFEIVRDMVLQQDNFLGSVKTMNTTTNPKALVADYTIKPAYEKNFNTLQKKYIALLKEINYPYPIEGFQPRIGAPRVTQIVIFPDNWESFYGSYDLMRFAENSLKYTEIKDILKQQAAMLLKKEEHRIDFVSDLSNP